VNAKQIKGLPVIGIAEGATLGKVDDVYIDVDARKLLGFVIDAENSMEVLDGAYLDPADIRSIGPDAVMVDSQEAVRGTSMRREIGSLVNIDSLLKRGVMTQSGVSVGNVSDVEFEPPDFKFTQLEVSPGLFQSNTKIPFAEVMSIGAEMIVVSDAVAKDATAGADAPKDDAPKATTAKETQPMPAPDATATPS